MHPVDSNSGRARWVVLNDLASTVLRRQIGHHHNLVFVHATAVIRNHGTTTVSARKRCVGWNLAWKAVQGLKRFGFMVCVTMGKQISLARGCPGLHCRKWKARKVKTGYRYKHTTPRTILKCMHSKLMSLLAIVSQIRATVNNWLLRNPVAHWIQMVRPTGLEPVTYGLEGR